MLDQNNRPYVEVAQNMPSVNVQEKIKLPDNTVGVYSVQKRQEPIVKKDHNLEAHGFFKSLVWMEVTKKEIWIPVKGTEGFERKSSLVVRTYSVNVEKCPCLQCSGKEQNFDYLKSMPTGVYRRCFKTDITVSFYLSGHTKNAYKLLHEVHISKDKARELIQSGAYCGDLGLRRELGVQEI